MGLPKLKTKISVEEYLEGEKISPIKHEYVEGEVYSMAGSSDTHNMIAGDVYAAFLVHLRNSRCQPFFGDIKVRVTSKVYYYPDVLVSYEENPEDAHFRNFPVLIVEVTSPSTKHIADARNCFFTSRYQAFRNTRSSTSIRSISSFIVVSRTAVGSLIISTKKTPKSNFNRSN